MPEDQEGWQRRPITRALLDSQRAGAEAASLDPAAAYLDQLGPGSRRTMREALAKLADWASQGRASSLTLAWHRLRIEHTAALRKRLAATLAPATANKHLAALRGVLRQCARNGSMSEVEYREAIALSPIRGARPRKRSRLGPRELARLAEACAVDPSPAGARDAALMATLCDAGLRRSEVVALEIADFDPATGVIAARVPGQKALRRSITRPGTRRALVQWISIRGSEPGPLFNPVNKGGRIERRGLSEQAIYIACRKRAAQAGLDPISPEDLRRADPASLTRIAPAESTGSRSASTRGGPDDPPRSD